MAINKAKIRQIHRVLAPIMVLPLILSVVTGSLYQIALLNQNFDYNWLIQAHKGNFGPVRLEMIYPFLNAIGLFVVAISGFTIWLQMRKPKRKPSATADAE
ncbi:MAG: PepSY domain-containing protein [Synechococcaceae cyanobacterium SM2_3_2]|nr:PepSY domain-containing protein [Synechococcaceae cyanobacterium SM2_3_2]